MVKAGYVRASNGDHLEGNGKENPMHVVAKAITLRRCASPWPGAAREANMARSVGEDGQVLASC